MKRGHVPERTCRGCGTRAPQGDLVRYIRHQGEIRVDSHPRGSGRGVYCCPNSVCRDRLLANRKLLRRVFRLQADE